MQREFSFFHRFKLDIIVLIGIILIGLGAILHHFPITISRDDAYGVAAMPQQLGQANILLILPETVQTTNNYPDMDFSFAWYNAMSQIFGPFSITLTNRIRSANDLSNAKIIVIPQNAAAQMNDDQIQLIAQNVQLGASLIIEMPGQAWTPITGVRLHSRGNSAIKRITAAPNSPLTGKYRDALLDVPLDTRVMRMDTSENHPIPSNGLLLEIDGAVAHAKRPLGAGFVYIFAFNFGQAITSLQQGRPSDALSIDTEEVPKTSNLILNEKMRANTIPYADILKNHVFACISQTTPIPMLWPFPEAHKSALILTHETGNLSDDAFLPAKTENEFKARSTWLVTASKMSSQTLRTQQEKGFEIGAALLRTPTQAVYKPLGTSFFHPILIEQTMKDQKTRIDEQASQSISTCKIAQSFWSHDYTASFRRLTAAKCRIDLSYAPGAHGDFGYLFGSSFPFLPIERNGLPIPIYEMPTLLDDTATSFASLPENIPVQLLNDAQNIWNTPIIANFNANTMQATPSYLSPQTWHDLLVFARDNAVWLPSVKAFVQHYTLRKQAQINYTWTPQTRTLDVQMRLPKADFNYTIAIPKRTAAGTLDALWLDKRPLDIEAGVLSSDGLLLLVPIPQDEHTLQGHYQ